MKAIILAGGMGKRLAPYTTILPKPLLPVGDMPILEVVVRQLRSRGITDIVMCVGYLGSLLEAYFGDGVKWDVHITYSYETEPLGTAGPIALVGGISEPFLVMNGDVLTTLDYADMLEFHDRHPGIATIGLAQKRMQVDLGVIELDAAGVVSSYVEKPALDYLVSMGIYIFSPDVLGFIVRGARLDLPDLILRLKDHGHSVVGYRGEYDWLDIGRPEDYAKAVDIFETDRAHYLPTPTTNASDSI
jgi:NDP-mannose synthase